MSSRKRPLPAAAENGDSSSSFLASSTWQGSKEGYYFGTGDHGVGYYLDVVDDTPQTTSPHNEVAKKPKKRGVVIAEELNTTHTPPPTNKNNDTTALDGAQLLAQAEQQQQQQSHKLLDISSPQGVRQAAHALQKAWDKNQLHRAQYADEPAQYMDSEVTLYEHVQALGALAADAPRLYTTLVQDTELVPILLQLAAQHENTDLVTAVWAVWAEWLDASLLLAAEDDEGGLASGMLQLVTAFLQDNNGISTLRESLDRLSQQAKSAAANSKQANPSADEDDAVGQGVGDLLTILENLLEMEITILTTRGEPLLIQQQASSSSSTQQQSSSNSSITQILAHSQWGLPAWLIQQVPSERQSPYRERALEILALWSPREELHHVCPDWTQLPIMKTTTSSEGATTSSDSPVVDGMEILLQTVAAFRKTQPQTENELDVLENACIVLDGALTWSATNVQRFGQAQGMQLVLRCLKERVHAGGVALKWLDFTTTTTSSNDSNSVYQKACQDLVHEASGLKYLMPLWMARNLPKLTILESMGKKETKRRKKEWNVNLQETTIRILYDLVRFLPEQDEHDCLARLVTKFAQDKDKCERLVELLLQYDEQARKAEYNFYKSDVEESLSSDQEVQLAALEAKLQGGGDLFHRLGAVAACIAVHSKACHEQMLRKLKQFQSGMGLVTVALEEFMQVLDDESGQKTKLQSYLDQL